MVRVVPGGGILGARIEDLDLGQPLPRATFDTVMRAIGEYGVLCFPGQDLQAAQLKAFAANFGKLEINVAGSFQEPGIPEVMILSNIVENGKPIGLADAGQDWHTDMTYNRVPGFVNVLVAHKVPMRDGKPLGGTAFTNTQAAYDDLPSDVKTRLTNATALHDHNQFQELKIGRAHV